MLQPNHTETKASAQAPAAIRVRAAQQADLAAVAELFDAYRQFYQQAPDLALAQRFIALAAQQPNTEVQLRADAAVPYGRVVAIMGAAHQAGLTRIGFVAEPVAAPPP